MTGYEIAAFNRAIAKAGQQFEPGTGEYWDVFGDFLSQAARNAYSEPDRRRLRGDAGDAYGLRFDTDRAHTDRYVCFFARIGKALHS